MLLSLGNQCNPVPEMTNGSELKKRSHATNPERSGQMVVIVNRLITGVEM